jgi:Pectate lyase superfamily protein
MRANRTISFTLLIGLTGSVFSGSSRITKAQTPGQIATEAFTRAGLPKPGTPGRLVRLTDDLRGLWFDTGTAWRSVTGTANVLDFGAIPDDDQDDSQAIQTAINAAAGRPIQVPDGTYRINRTLISQTTAANEEGLKLIGAGRFRVTFDNRVASGPMLSLRSDGSSGTRQKHVVIQGLTIKCNVKPAPRDSDGIRIINTWHARITDIAIAGLSGNALSIDGVNGDSEASGEVELKNVDFSENAGYGVKVITDVAPHNNLLSYLNVEDSRFLYNRAGGVVYNGLTATIRRTSISYNGGTGGFFAPYVAYAIQNVSIEFCEFDTNYPTNIKIESGRGISIVDTQFTGNNGANPSGNTLKGVVLGLSQGPTVGPAHVARNRVRLDPRLTPYIQYEFNNPQSGGIVVEDTFWQAFDTKTQTMYADNGTMNLIIRENNKYLGLSNFESLEATGFVKVGGGSKIQNVLFGGAQFTNGTVSVTLPITLPDPVYRVSLTPQSNESVWVTNKTAKGFTIHSSNANSVAIVDWILMR